MGHVRRCPICRDQMTYDERALLIDCPQLHRLTTDPFEWDRANLRLVLEQLDASDHPCDQVTDHDHDWVVIERTDQESLAECASCAAWRMGPP